MCFNCGTVSDDFQQHLGCHGFTNFTGTLALWGNSRRINLFTLMCLHMALFHLLTLKFFSPMRWTSLGDKGRSKLEEMDRRAEKGSMETDERGVIGGRYWRRWVMRRNWEGWGMRVESGKNGGKRWEGWERLSKAKRDGRERGGVWCKTAYK